MFLSFLIDSSIAVRFIQCKRIIVNTCIEIKNNYKMYDGILMNSNIIAMITLLREDTVYA